MINRREFVLGSAAFALSTGAAFAERRGTPRLRVALLSDLHLWKPKDEEKYRKALLKIRERNPDAVLCAGDITDNGLLRQLKRAARIYDEVFPGGRNADGSEVVRLFHYGDHDTGGYAHVNRVIEVTGKMLPTGDMLQKHYGISEREVNAECIHGMRKRAWEEAMGEPYEPYTVRTVKGYTFVLAHWQPESANSAPGLADRLAALNLPSGKPFFYSQHRVYKDTVNGPAAWGQDHGEAKSVLSRFPNCVAFCGHGHVSAVRRDSVWQGGFTAIEIPSLNYVSPGMDADGREFVNKEGVGRYDSEQAMFMTVYDDGIVLEALDFTTDEKLAPDWVIPPDAGLGAFSRESVAAAMPVPAFREGARVLQVLNFKGNISCSFSPEKGGDGRPRPYYYRVTAESADGEAKVERNLLPDRCWAAPSAMKDIMWAAFPLESFKGREKGVKITIRPCDIFGRSANSIKAVFNG